MQIDKIQNIQIQALRDGIGAKDGTRKSTNIPQQTTAIDINYQEYAAEAISSDDAQKIEEARKLLLSGALDTPQAARKAAQNIIKFGI